MGQHHPKLAHRANFLARLGIGRQLAHFLGAPEIKQIVGYILTKSDKIKLATHDLGRPRRGRGRLSAGQPQAGFVYTRPETATIQIIETGCRPSVDLRQGDRVVMAPELDIEKAVVQSDIANRFQSLLRQHFLDVGRLPGR